MSSKKRSKKQQMSEEISEEISEEVESPVKKPKKKPAKKQPVKKAVKKAKKVVKEEDSISESETVIRETAPPNEKVGNLAHAQLKQNILSWLNDDDKIKELNAETKKYKVAKKAKEDNIIKMINKLGLEETPLVIKDDDNKLRGHVRRNKSVTSGAIKHDIIKKTLMEVIKNESQVDQLVLKIENNRPKVTRYYLKRTKGINEEKKSTKK
uniref:Uncharacterized protein n=1 Tax=viral metagenome TaxID=1070528 RepID=A0A6C0C8Y1_9ZZZZ